VFQIKQRLEFLQKELLKKKQKLEVTYILYDNIGCKETVDYASP